MLAYMMAGFHDLLRSGNHTRDARPPPPDA
jgi:hypothetical protein